MRLGRRLALALLVLAAGLQVPVAAGVTITRTVYFSATDASGAPEDNLSAADITVKEGGKERVVSSLKPATETMDIAILVDDGGRGVYQLGVMHFLQELLGYARFAISRFSPQAIKIVDYTNDIAPLQRGLDLLGRRGSAMTDGEQLVEAVYNSAKELQERNAVRPVILVLTIAGDTEVRNPDITLNYLRHSGVMLNVLFVDAAHLVLGDGPRETGGLAERVVASASIDPGLQKIATALKHQYALTYTLPDGVKRSDRLSISTKKYGISIHAPKWIPNR
jgi:hypothetical protein